MKLNRITLILVLLLTITIIVGYQYLVWRCECNTCYSSDPNVEYYNQLIIENYDETKEM